MGVLRGKTPASGAGSAWFAARCDRRWSGRRVWPERKVMGEIRYYEDVEVGEEFRSRTRTITETDVVGFASLSDDWSEVHISEEFAKGTAYGRRIAHGLLGSRSRRPAAGRADQPGSGCVARDLDFQPVFSATIRVRAGRDKRTTRIPRDLFLALELIHQRRGRARGRAPADGGDPEGREVGVRVTSRSRGVGEGGRWRGPS
jgi:acyl dehydratase